MTDGICKRAEGSEERPRQKSPLQGNEGPGYYALLSLHVPAVEIGAEESFRKELERALAKAWRIWNVMRRTSGK